jgi:predicted component of type VI protein secretion system
LSFLGKLAGGREERMVDSIARNLTAVLNAKQGHAAAVEVFGLGRYDGQFAQSGQVSVLTAEMLEQVNRFEPRLKDPALALLGRDRALWVRFMLTGRCEGQPCAFSVLFHAVFRHVRVLPA